MKVLGFGLLAVIFLAGGLSRLRAQQAASSPPQAISVQTSPQIFATMCALDAAGYDVDESTLGEMRERLALRGDLLNMHGPATEALRKFYREHALANPAETLSRYISFALMAGPPPQFSMQESRETLPPDVLTIEGFQELLANFYAEAQLRLRWIEVAPEYEPVVRRYQASLARIVTVSDAYLREIIQPSMSRSFTVYVEPFVGARTNFRNYGVHYDIVVGPFSDAPVRAIQHAYLHFMLDPLVMRARAPIEMKSALLNVAARAPRLPIEYQDDFVSLTDECLVQAVELRLRHLSPEQLEAALRDADSDGFILVRPFVTQLQRFEKSEPAMSYYFPDLIRGIDVQAEQKRFQGFTFASGPTPAMEEQTSADNTQVSEVDQWLAAGDQEIAHQNIPAAAAAFEKVVAQSPNDPRGLYGLAIASVLSGNARRAKDLFEKIVSEENAPNGPARGSAGLLNPTILAWSHVYLGRIHDLEDARDLAMSEYKEALAVNGAPEAARLAAQSGVEAAYKPHSRPAATEQQQP